MASRLENAIDAIQDEFQNITTANGYRNDLATHQVIRTIRHPGQITTHPEIGVQPIDEEWEAFDGKRTLFNAIVTIRVAGRVKPYIDLTPDAVKMQESIDSLVHDMNKIMAAMLTKYKVDSTSPWLVLGGDWKVTRNTHLAPMFGWGEVVLTFKILLRNVTTSFD